MPRLSSAGWDPRLSSVLMNAKGIELLAGFPHADAYVALYPFLNKLVLRRGSADLLNNRPPADVVLGWRRRPGSPQCEQVCIRPSSIFCLTLLSRFIHSPEFSKNWAISCRRGD